MRDNQNVLTDVQGLLPAFAVAFICFITVILSAGPILANEISLKPSTTPDIMFAPSPPDAHPGTEKSQPFMALRSTSRPIFTQTDKLTALESLQYALSEVADGASYVWHRNHGQLSGIVQPVRSYFGRNGEVCRELVVFFTSHDINRKTKASACRMADGIWRLNS